MDPLPMSVEQRVAQHYTHGSLAEAVFGALRSMGKDPDRLAAADLDLIDKFHIGGLLGTQHFALRMGVRRGMHLLDIGSGMGGVSRYFAGVRRCTVAGIDLTEECVRVADDLTLRTGLDGVASFRQGSALDLPFEAASFDRAYMLHVGMNIENKAHLFTGVRRVLKPGGLFAVHDVMRIRDGNVLFPVPWAATPATSFLSTPADYRRLLAAAGFEILKESSHGSFAYSFLQLMKMGMLREQYAVTLPLCISIALGAEFPVVMANMLTNVSIGPIEPIEIVCRAV